MPDVVKYLQAQRENNVAHVMSGERKPTAEHKYSAE
jgi:hypothetical protein